MAFSSEIKALLPFAFVPKRLNHQVVYEYLAYGAVEYNQESFFAGVQKLLRPSALSGSYRPAPSTVSGTTSHLRKSTAQLMDPKRPRIAPPADR